MSRYSGDEALRKFHMENAEGLRCIEKVAMATSNNRDSWSNEKFAKTFPNLSELAMKKDDLTKASLAVWSAVIGTPTVTSRLAYKSAIALLLFCTPKEAEKSYDIYREVMAEIGGQEIPSSTNIVGALPKTTMSAEGLTGDSTSFDFLVEYFGLGADMKIPADVIVDGVSESNPLVDVYGNLERDTVKHTMDKKEASAKSLMNIFSIINKNEKGGPMTAATIGSSLLIIAGLKGIKAMQNRAIRLRIPIGEGPDNNYVSEGFSSTRQILATTLCLIERAIAMKALEMRPEAEGCYEKHIQVRTRYNRLALPGLVNSLVQAKLFKGGMEGLVDNTLLKSTIDSWKTHAAFCRAVDTQARKIILPEHQSDFCDQFISYFVAPYIRIFNENSLSELGTTQNRVLVCILAGITAGVRDYGTIRDQLSAYQPFTSLPEQTQHIIVCAAELAVQEIVGVEVNYSTFELGSRIKGVLGDVNSLVKSSRRADYREENAEIPKEREPSVLITNKAVDNVLKRSGVNEVAAPTIPLNPDGKPKYLV